MCEWGKTTSVMVMVPADLSFTGKSRYEHVKIDACIADLIAALQRSGLYTRSCCCGHGKYDGHIELCDGRTLTITFDKAERR
jgi:hypothetical protein